jgi:hypothetical protein
VTRLFVGILMSIVLSTIVVVAISKPLHAVLSDICDTERRSRFWQIFTGIMLYVTPMLAVIVVGVGIGSAGAVALFDVSYLRGILGSTLASLLVTLLALGSQIANSPARAAVRPLRPADRGSIWNEGGPLPPQAT